MCRLIRVFSVCVEKLWFLINLNGESKIQSLVCIAMQIGRFDTLPVSYKVPYSGTMANLLNNPNVLTPSKYLTDF